MRIILFSLLTIFALSPSVGFAQDNHGEGEKQEASHQEGDDHDTAEHGDESGHGDGHEEEIPYVDRIIEHISDANEFHLWGDVSIPLPCIFYSFEDGFTFTSSKAFHHGHEAVAGYVLHHGDAKRIKDWDESMHVEHIDHIEAKEVANAEGEMIEKYFAISEGEEYELEKASTLLKFTSWIDFSITKVVFTMFMTAILLIFLWLGIAKTYRNREGKAPKGVQSFFEPFFEFMRDEVVKPSIGPKYERYMPFIMTLFFFILFNNILGLVPIFPGSANVTGNLGVTLVLAFFTMVITNFSANKDYWQHIFWMPGVPTPVRFILAPVELAGVFIKPFTLLIRLFANITAGHVIILCLVGLVFILGENGKNIGGAAAGGTIAVLFMFMMNLLELLVAFIQAFIFALLSSLYIGMAIEEHHHDEEHAH